MAFDLSLVGGSWKGHNVPISTPFFAPAAGGTPRPRQPLAASAPRCLPIACPPRWTYITGIAVLLILRARGGPVVVLESSFDQERGCLRRVGGLS